MKFFGKLTSSGQNIARDFRARAYRRFRPHNICMLHVGRCGSTVIANQLAQHPQIEWVGEFFNDNKLPGFLDMYDTKDPFYALHLRSGIAKFRSFGFEVKAHPVLHPSNIGMSMERMIDECARSAGCTKFILLDRANLLRRFVSFFTGQKRGKYTFSRDDSPERVNVRVPTGKFKFGNGEASLTEFFDSFTGIKNQWKSAIPDNCKTIELEYARDILDDPSVAYSRIVNWLKLDEYEADVKNRKVGSRPLSQVVTNWKEVCKMLKKTKYEWMLEDEK